MKTILSFQDESHRVQLVECDRVGSLEKHVIYDNRHVIHTYFADESHARMFFHSYIGNFILQQNIMFKN